MAVVIAALRRMPAPLQFAQIGAIVVTLSGGWGDDDAAPRTLLAGSWFAFSVLSTVGYAWLARQLKGRARLGVRLAFGASLLVVVAHLATSARIAYGAVSGSFESEIELYAISIARATLEVLIVIGLGIAVGRWYWIALGAIISFIASPPWFVWEPMCGWAGDYAKTVFFAIALASAFITLLLTVRASRTATDEARPPGGMRRIVLALYGQVIATVALLCFTLLIDASSSQRIAVVLATGLELVCLVMLALGVIFASGSLARWLAIASAAAALSVAGTMIYRLLGLILRDFGSSELWPVRPQPTFMLTIAAQVVMTGAIGGLLVALAIAARRRGREALRARLFARIGAFVVLSLGAITARDMLGMPYELTPLGIAAANGALVASWILAARAMRASVLPGDSNLPAATLVKR
jgi:hypothetical protein